jgi:fructokinase
MSKMSDSNGFLVVGLGEVLWDMLPAGVHLGGAPANFAYIAGILGARSVIASRVGEDELGRSAVALLQAPGIDVSCVQLDSLHPTGTSVATLENNGTARYCIRENVAWDHIAWTPELAHLAARADAVCFGTLAQRTDESMRTVRKFLEHTKPDCIRVFDANLRPPFWNRDILIESFQRARVVKLNEEELPFALECSSLDESTVLEAANALRERWRLLALCVTRGRHGSVIATADGTAVHDGQPAEVVDTVGAGDAFAAAMTLQLLNQASAARVSEAANAVACWLVSRPGAMPAVSGAERARLRKCFGAGEVNRAQNVNVTSLR